MGKHEVPPTPKPIPPSRRVRVARGYAALIEALECIGSENEYPDKHMARVIVEAEVDLDVLAEVVLEWLAEARGK